MDDFVFENEIKQNKYYIRNKTKKKEENVYTIDRTKNNKTNE